MTLAAFYTRLEKLWTDAGLVVIKRQPIVRGDPTEGWRWLLMREGNTEQHWCAFNADGLLPSQHEVDPAKYACGVLRREPPTASSRTAVVTDEEAAEVVARPILEAMA